MSGQNHAQPHFSNSIANPSAIAKPLRRNAHNQHTDTHHGSTLDRSHPSEQHNRIPTDHHLPQLLIKLQQPPRLNVIHPQSPFLALRAIILIHHLQPPRRVVQHPAHAPLGTEPHLRPGQLRRRGRRLRLDVQIHPLLRGDLVVTPGLAFQVVQRRRARRLRGRFWFGLEGLLARGGPGLLEAGEAGFDFFRVFRASGGAGAEGGEGGAAV